MRTIKETINDALKEVVIIIPEYAHGVLSNPSLFKIAEKVIREALWRLGRDEYGDGILIRFSASCPLCDETDAFIRNHVYCIYVDNAIHEPVHMDICLKLHCSKTKGYTFTVEDMYSANSELFTSTDLKALSLELYEKGIKDNLEQIEKYKASLNK